MNSNHVHKGKNDHATLICLSASDLASFMPITRHENIIFVPIQVRWNIITGTAVLVVRSTRLSLFRPQLYHILMHRVLVRHILTAHELCS